MEKMDGVKRAQEGQVTMRQQKGVRRSEDETWEFPGSTVVRIPCFHCRGAQVRSLVRELRYCPCKQRPHPTPPKLKSFWSLCDYPGLGHIPENKNMCPCALGGDSPAMLF